jgi:hypothetical protein
MFGGYSIIAYRHLWLAGVAVILLFMTCGVISGFAAVEPAEPILQLKPDKNHYFLGPSV